MASSPSQDDRRQRLNQIASEWQIVSLPQLAPLTRPPKSPLSSGSRTPNDDFVAEDLLKRRRLGNAQGHSSQGGGIKRAFTTNKKKGWEPKEIFDALEAHVTSGGSPGVAEALIAKLVSAGGDMNVVNMKGKTNILGRRKSVETFERSRILQKAIERQHTDMVAVLVSHADPFTLDSNLPLAVRSGNIPIAELLLRHGANASETADGQDAFRQLCVAGGQADLVGLILASNGRPNSSWVSQAMIDASKKGCLDTVLRLSRSTADGNYKSAAALKEAIDQCRVDIALAILTGAKPPTGTFVNEAFQKIFAHTSILPNEKMALAEILLCAGAEGDVVANALAQSASTGFFEMVHLLISYGASVEYQDANVLRGAISKGKSNLVHLLLSDNVSLSPIYASECVESIPKSPTRISSDDRHAILSLLLRKGARGPALDECLVDAAEAGDIESVKLLLTAHFPGGRPVEGYDLRRGSRGMVYDRHATASVDYKDGLALKCALARSNIPIVDVVLSRSPSVETLGKVFPSIHRLAPVERYKMAERFLSMGLPAPCIHEALQQAIEERPPKRDERLIALLLKHNAGANFGDSANILAAISQQDVALLEALVQSNPPAQIAAAGIPSAMAVADPAIRNRMISLLLDAGAGSDGARVAEALVSALQMKTTDTQLLEMLVKRGSPDINYQAGAAIVLATSNPDPSVLELLLQTGKASPANLSRAMQTLSKLPSTAAKATKLEVILRHSTQKEALSSLLITEVETVLKTEPQQRVLSVVRSLLSSGADVNAHGASAFCNAIKHANAQLTDMLFAAHPKPASLAAALPHALRIADPMDRLTYTRKLLDAGAPGAEANRAMVHAVRTFPDDLPLISTLASKAEAEDGEALSAAVKKEKCEFVECMLARAPKKYAATTLNSTLAMAMKGSDRDKRKTICTLLLKAGASGTVVSDALLTAASDGDVGLGSVLLENGASVEHQEGQAVVEACRSGAADVLRMLLKSPTAVKNVTLARGFQAATQVSDLKKRGDVFRLLLERGVHGEVVDAQLISSARYGDDGIELVKLLLEFGASTDFNSGEAVWTSTRSAFLPSLELMLGVTQVGGEQKKPSHSTMIRALKASWRLSPAPRYQVIEWLFKAGLPVTEEVHIALNKTVNDEELNLKIVQLLLASGASPLTNGCQTLVDATQKLLVPALELFLESEVPQSDLNWAFAQGFAPGDVDTWLSEQGLVVAKLLLNKGAKGDGPATALVVALDNCGAEKDAIARQFVEVLLEYKADVNFGHGLPVQAAARLGSPDTISEILALKPNTESLSMAFPYIFDSDHPEDEVVSLITLFTEYRYSGEEGLDVMFKHPTCEPVIFRALARYPRSARILQAFLDAGYYHDQMAMAQVMPEEIEEEEQVSLLFWALLQPQKKVSSAIIEMLVKKGAKVNFETRISKTTPLMLAIQSRRHDIVKLLIQEGAEVDVADATGNTPLTMATRMGGDLGTRMMSNLLAAEPSKNDGSLHNAARELNILAMKVLVENGHEVDFPSPLHGGRSALGEICLHAASQSGEMTSATEKTMEKAMTYLIEQDTDLSLKSHGKSLLLLALEAAHPVPVTRALLKIGMWKFINRPFNYYTDGTYTYSPTMYVARVLPASDTNIELLALLKANRADDVFYANDGPQPPDAKGVPDELRRADVERRARISRIAAETEDSERALAQTRAAAAVQNEILAERARLEEERRRRRRQDDIEAVQAHAAAEEEAFNAAVRRQRAERQAALRHAAALAEAEVERTRRIGDAEIDVQDRRARAERLLLADRLESNKQMSAVRVREREDLDKIDRDADRRTRGRIGEHKKLIEAQAQLATKLSTAGLNGRRLGGYITGEIE